MKTKTSFVYLGLLFFVGALIKLPQTGAYFTDTAVLEGNLMSIGYWENPEIELKKPLDGHTYFLGQEIQILWRVLNAHPHSNFTFRIFLVDESGDEEELNLEDLECGPFANAPLYERWCKWMPKEIGRFKIRIETESKETGKVGEDKNESYFIVGEKPGKNRY